MQPPLTAAPQAPLPLRRLGLVADQLRHGYAPAKRGSIPVAGSAGDGCGSGWGGLQLRLRRLVPSDIILGCTFNTPSAGGGLTMAPRELAIATVVTAVQHGIRVLDTAPLYGAGVSEECIGAALEQLGATVASTVTVYTKSGVLVRAAMATGIADGTPPAGFSGERATRRGYSEGMAGLGLRESLSRLGSLAKVQGLRVHGPHRSDCVMTGYGGASGKAVVKSELTDDGISTVLSEAGILKELQAMRVAGAIEEVSLGLNAFDPDVVQRVLPLFTTPASGTVQSALLAGGWNLLNQNAAPLLVAAQERGISIHIAGVFSSGLLTGGSTVYHPGSDSGQSPPASVQALLAGWEALIKQYEGLSLATVALAFACLPEVVTKVVIGCSAPAEVTENLKRVPTVAAVPAALWAEAQARGLLSPLLRLPGGTH